MREHQSDTILVSGGAEGVDKTAETLWLGLGGEVISFRVRQLSPIKFVAEKWHLGGSQPRVYPIDHPTWADRVSALFWRDMLIAEEADRVVAFYRRGKSGGTAATVDAAYAEGDDVYEYEAGVIAA